ncbi:MAG: phospholipase D-like domain-containing protein [Polyangiaceae bacterium]
MGWRRLGGGLLFVSVWLVAACGDDSQTGGAGAGGTDLGGSSSGAANAGGQGGGVGGGAQGGSAPVPESCDPFEPRVDPPEVWVLPDGFASNVVELIGTAETSLDVMMYQFTVQSIADALVAAHDRGVLVRVLLDPDETVNDTVRATLTGSGIEVRDAPATFSYAHAKVVVVDGARAMVSSGNFNSYSTSSERNYAAIDTAADDVDDLEAVFEHDWSGAPLDLSCTRLVVSPDNAKARLTALISSATTSLDLAVMYLSDTGLRDAVAGRVAAGVPVRILLADPSWISGNAQAATELAAIGAEVEFCVDYELHAKLIVADDTVFIGSENLSYTALTKNREVGIFVEEAPGAALVKQTFESDWAQGVPP